jgi:hypothetical protein
MTAINFPDTPEVGDTFSVGQITWEWTGSVWKGFTDTSANVTVSTTPPDDTGSIWFNSENGIAYIYYDSYWTSLAGSSGAPIISDTAPSDPVLGTQWFNSSNGKSYLYYSNAWIEVDSNGTAATSGNTVINGGFDIWQRGTSFNTSSLYTADRWACFYTAGTTTFSREATIVPPGQIYSMKLTQTVATTTPYIFQSVETANTIPLAGQQVTISAYVYGTVSSSFSLELFFSTTVDKTPVTSWDGSVASVTQSVGPTWTRITATGVVPSNAKSLRIGVLVNGLALSQPAYISGVQLEAGPVATPFKRNAPSIQAELAACQRYYWRRTAESVYQAFGQGFWEGGSVRILIFVNHPVTMRATPTSIDWGGPLMAYEGGAINAVTGVTIGNFSSSTRSRLNFAVTSNGTYGIPYEIMSNNSTSAFIGFSAEL